MAEAFGVAFRLDDETRAAYEKFGIALVDSDGAARPTLPVPSVFLIGADRRIAFQHVDPDYKVRLDADALLAAARGASNVTR